MSTKKTDVLGNLVYASSSMSFASEIPGYNGSLFAISDGIKDRIESDLIEARAAVAELIEALREIADVTTPGDGVPNEVWINERANKALANIGETK